MREDMRQLTLPDNRFSDKYDVLKFSADVKSITLKDNITSDYIMAKLDEKTKLYIVEMTSNAFFMRSVVLAIVNNANEKCADHKRLIQSLNLKSRLIDLQKDRIDYVNEVADHLFNSYLVKNDMLVILSRNTKSNDLLKMILDSKEDRESDDQQQEDRLRELLKPQE